MKKIAYSLFIFFISFFIFDIKNVNTVDGIALIYDNKDEDEEKYFTISFYDLSVLQIDDAFNGLNITILSVKPFDYEKIYYTNTYNLIENYNKMFLNEESILSGLKSFKVESMTVICTESELSRLEKRIKII